METGVNPPSRALANQLHMEGQLKLLPWMQAIATIQGQCCVQTLQAVLRSKPKSELDRQAEIYQILQQ